MLLVVGVRGGVWFAERLGVAEESPKLFGEKVPCAGSTSCSLQLSDASVTSGWVIPVGI